MHPLTLSLELHCTLHPLTAHTLLALFQVHKAIRENPAAAPKKQRDLAAMPAPKRKKQKKLNAEERRLRRIAKIEELAKKGQEEEDNAVGMDVEESDEEES